MDINDLINPDFSGTSSSDDLWYGAETSICLTDVVAHKSDYDHTHDGYATLDHTHDGYVSSDDLQTLEDIVETKANATHSHSEYALTDHSHNGYALQASLDSLNEVVEGKANASHTHTDYALLSHSHSDYVTTTDFDSLESEVNGKADANHSHTDYSLTTHNHDSNYSPLTHSHTASEIGAATSGHNHDSIYATITSLNELSSAVSSKASSSHNHDGAYDEYGSAASALTSANAYTDSKIDALVGEGASTTLDTIGEISSAIVDNQDTIDILNAAIANKANVTDLNSHASDTEIHITDAERNVWNAKSDFSGSYNDLTDQPSIPSISGLATETYVDEAVSTKADSGHNHNSVYYTETEVDSLLSAKANSNHNHNSSYDALGTAETKANAVQANLDVVGEDLAEHIDNADIHFTVAERTKLSGIATNANKYTHPNSGVTAGTYKSVTVNAQGHITSGSNPTTLVGYGITDAETKGAANSALSSAKAYADELIADEVTNRDSAIATAKSSAISTAASDATTKANNALASAKTYADNAAATVKNDLLNNAGAAYDTLKELGDLIDDNADAIEALESVASGKANAVHTHAISDITNLQTTLNGKAAISHGAHVSYSTTAPVMDGTASVGSASTVARSDHKHPTDTSRASQSDLDALETVVAGKAASSHTHTIANITNLQSTLDGKASSTHTHSAATTSADGLMSASDKSKLDGIASGANKYTLPTASSTLGGVKTTSTVTSNSGYNACPIIEGVPYYKDTNTTYNLGSFGVTATAAELNVLDGITATVTELNYMDGVTSNVQTQLNGKSSTSHTHSYAGSSSVGGAATSANKLNTNAGDANTPVYFANGIPVACTSLDLNTTGSSASCTGNAATATNVAWSGVTSKPSYYDAKAIKSITRSGTTFTYTCMDGTTGTFTQQDNNTTYSVATTSANGLMSASDKSKLDGMVLATVSEVETYLGI